MPSSSSSRWLRRAASLAARLAGGLLLLVSLCGATCSVRYHSGHHCHEDPDCDHEIDGGAQLESSAGGQGFTARMSAYRTVPARDPFAHPVAAVLETEGAATARADLGHPARLYRFTRAVIAANPEVLGLPPSHATRLVPAGTRSWPGGVEVLWQQVQAGNGKSVAWPGSWVVFRLAEDGRLVHVEQRLRLGWAPPGTALTGG